MGTKAGIRDEDKNITLLQMVLRHKSATAKLELPFIYSYDFLDARLTMVLRWRYGRRDQINFSIVYAGILFGLINFFPSHCLLTFKLRGSAALVFYYKQVLIEFKLQKSFPINISVFKRGYRIEDASNSQALEYPLSLHMIKLY